MELKGSPYDGHRETFYFSHRAHRGHRDKNFYCETEDTLKTETLKSWEDFEEALAAINRQIEKLQQEKKRSRMEYPLYRGVSDFEHHLESTLDRIQKVLSFSDYCKILRIVNKSIATCTGRKWDLDTKEPKISLGEFNLPVPTYEFMTYLRHNGFPSPLIDWTKSPYIAAYFAFRDIYSTAKSVSIFVHMGKILYGQPLCSIWRLGPTITTDSKHYLQQSEYSVCVKHQGKELYFANHENVEEDEEGADILIKYNIPISEQQKVLKKLDSMNITAYSLFNSEPSLMETLALREIILK